MNTPILVHRFFNHAVCKLLIIAVCAAALASCGTVQTSGTAPAPVIASTGQDLQALAAAATQDYIDYKAGNTNYAWSITKGLEAYRLAVKTAGDVKAVVQQWSDGSAAGKSFAQKLAALFAQASGTPAQKAEAIAQAVGSAAANKGP